MNFKSLLLGAAAVASATGVQAADLPVAPEPVDYVRICDAYGARFYYIPGTETCLRVGGRVRADYRINDFAHDGGNSWDDNEDTSTNFRARAYVQMDARTQTEYGLLRTYMDLWFTTNATGDTPAVTIWEAYVQLGGFTFGRTGSFSDHWTGENWGANIGQGLDDRATVLAYTAAFGNGLSATIALEDGLARRRTLVNNTGVGASSGGALSAANIDTYGGHKIPNFVANLLVSQGWGSAQLSGVLTQVYSGDIQAYNSTTGGTTTVANIHDSPLGWAINADVALNLPMLGAGDTLGIRAGYSNGALGYVNEHLTVDAVATSLTNVKTATGWGIAAGITHNWTPTVSTSVTGTYASQDAAGISYDLDTWSVNGQVAWAPISGFVTGVEVEYLNRDYSGTLNPDNDDLVATFRVQRTF